MKTNILLTAFLFMAITVSAQKPGFKWGQLASIPDEHGFAGSFAGISNGALIVAGGANFPDGGAPWTGSKKAWTDKIFVLKKPTGKWKLAATLPQPLGYGVSISYHNKLICVGGSNTGGHVATVFAMNYINGKIEIENWPELPEALANSCGAVVGHTLYIAGGLLSPDAKNTASVFWSLDLDKPKSGWKNLATWPGSPRMLSVAGSLNGTFYLFSGTDLEDKAGVAHRHYLTDAYAHTPGTGWKKLADLPRAVVAAAGPASPYHKNQLLIFGGDDGALADNAAALKEKHPGFSGDILSYNTTANKWTSAGRIKTNKLSDAAENPNKSLWAPVTTTSVLWHGALVIPGGEVRPAVRTARVLTVHIPSAIK
ncbi:galactose oxidase [Mucilaginibacter sp. UYCu711]|uniref:galactose oxidase n=1 Tax=Mucilaginibacter sp. UYCu711 TaxID=3156339 RepID=UPI003D1D102E